MIKSRYIVVFVLLISILFASMGLTYNRNYSDHLSHTYESVEGITESASYLYDSIFFSICQTVENGMEVIRENPRDYDLLESTITLEVKESYYISDIAILYEGGQYVKTGMMPNFSFRELDIYYETPEEQLCIGLIQHNENPNVYYAVNRVIDTEGNTVLMLVAIDYNLINTVVRPESYDILNGSLYLISNDGYFLYHKDPEIMGTNLFVDKEFVKEKVKLSDADYKVLSKAMYNRSRSSAPKYLEYHAENIEKMGFYKQLSAFSGVVFITIDFTSLKAHQYKVMMRSFIPLLLVLVLAIYVLLKYIYMIKFTDYFTEVMNERAFQHHLQKEKKKGKESEYYLILKVDNFLDGERNEIKYNDEVFYTISEHCKALKSEYEKLYRISRVHYLFVLKSGEYHSKENKEILRSLRGRISTKEGETAFVRGKYAFYHMDSIQSLEDYSADSIMIQHMESHFNFLTETEAHKSSVYSEILAVQRSRAEEKLILESAILDKRIDLFYQPIVDLKTNMVISNEVQIRIKTDEGYLMPGPFIRLAEEEALIEKLDRMMIEKAFQYTYKCWMNTRHRIDLSLNLSAKSINEGMVTFILEYAEKSMVKKSSVTFELTETADFRNLEDAVHQLKRLSKAGFKLAIDDFGTGFSHVELLSKVPVNYVKIDGKYVKNAAQKAQSLKTLNALVYLAKNYDAEIIAKFVESAKDMIVLNKMGVEYGQGYYYAPPAKDPILELNK